MKLYGPEGQMALKGEWSQTALTTAFDSRLKFHVYFHIIYYIFKNSYLKIILHFLDCSHHKERFIFNFNIFRPIPIILNIIILFL